MTAHILYLGFPYAKIITKTLEGMLTYLMFYYECDISEAFELISSGLYMKVKKLENDENELKVTYEIKKRIKLLNKNYFETTKFPEDACWSHI